MLSKGDCGGENRYKLDKLDKTEHHSGNNKINYRSKSRGWWHLDLHSFNFPFIFHLSYLNCLYKAGEWVLNTLVTNIQMSCWRFAVIFEPSSEDLKMLPSVHVWLSRKQLLLKTDQHIIHKWRTGIFLLKRGPGRRSEVVIKSNSWSPPDGSFKELDIHAQLEVL